jgi:hypothetical protein
MSADRISLVNFMYGLADDISPQLQHLDADTQHFIDQTMFDALCAANDRNATEVKRLVSLVRWKIGQERVCCDGC